MIEVARLELQALAEFRQITLEQHTSGYKWLTASLLAVNGGAAAALLSADKIRLTDVRWAFVAFVFGILLSLASARLNQSFAMKALPSLQEMSGYWASVMVTGARDDAREKALNGKAKSSMRGAWLGQAAGWASALSFVVGVVLVGLNVR
ncbi:hypothetical protein [Sphingomonas sp.]|uniref:hypothetical protein n=1 Tax=Sphingomonas sp. TaxID=28214 RepID=UPI002ED7E1BF